jgi:hypothetical protein
MEKKNVLRVVILVFCIFYVRLSFAEDSMLPYKGGSTWTGGSAIGCIILDKIFIKFFVDF